MKKHIWFWASVFFVSDVISEAGFWSFTSLDRKIQKELMGMLGLQDVGKSKWDMLVWAFFMKNDVLRRLLDFKANE